MPPAVRPTPVRCRSTNRHGQRRRDRAGAPPMASNASGRDAPAPADDGDEVATEAALRRQQHRLGERRRHGRVEGVAAVPQRRRPGLGGERCGGAHHTTGTAPRALLGHHREDGVTAHVSLPMRANERSPVSGHGRPAWPGDASGGTSEKWVWTPSHGSPGDVAPQHDGGPAGAGEAWSHRPRSRSNPRARRQLPGSRRGRRSRPARRRGSVNPSIGGQTFRHCCSSSSSRPWTTSAWVPKDTTSGAKRRRAVVMSTPATSAPHAAIQSRTVDRIDSASGRSCILVEKVYSIR